MFTTRYPGTAAYTDAEEMLRAERPEVVAIATNTAGRAELTVLALKYGAKAIFTVRLALQTSHCSPFPRAFNHPTHPPPPFS